MILPTWPEVVSALAVVGSLAGWMYTWATTRYRSRLKDDLEILKGYSEAFPPQNGRVDQNETDLRRSIEGMIRKGYSREPSRGKTLSWGLWFVVIGIANLAVTPLSWVNLIAGILSVGWGIAVLIVAVARRAIVSERT